MDTGKKQNSSGLFTSSLKCNEDFQQIQEHMLGLRSFQPQRRAGKVESELEQEQEQEPSAAQASTAAAQAGLQHLQQLLL